jgi:pyruvate/2-oxoglutarate dehydrogenase complex dihydrolipoamide acyltransferase (E2) component
MTVKVNFPKAGMGIDEGTIAKWFKTKGEKVLEGEPLVEIETAKALQEVLAPASGILADILVSEGQTASVNSTLGLIEADRD